jgi:hypothetical protein
MSTFAWYMLEGREFGLENMYLYSKYINSSTNLLFIPYIVQIVMVSMVVANFVTEAPANKGWHDNKISVKFKS